MNTALMPFGKQQFFSSNGVPLAGGFVFSYAAGTTTPLATYQDANGAAANTNPVVLDAGGFGNIWLTADAYKIVVEDADGVQVWSQDNVSAVSQAELQGNSSFASVAISGDLTVGGDETVAGKITAATLEVTGTAAVDGALTAATAAVTGNETVGGTFGVTGATTLDDATVAGDLTVTGAADLNGAVNIGAMTLAAYILAQIPAMGGLAGTALITDITTSGNWVIFTFGATAGSRIRIALGSASGAANGSSIALPSGFNTTNLFAGAWLAAVATTPGNQLSQFSASITSGVISVAASDNSGHNFTPTAGWFAAAWITGY
jgi:hypothetical protein